MSRTMLNEHSLPEYFWAKTINTSYYLINHVIIRKGLDKAPYKLWNDKKPNIAYFKVFGCKCFILNDREHLEKFNAKSNKEFFLNMPQIVKLTVFIIGKVCLFKNLCMLYLMS